MLTYLVEHIEFTEKKYDALCRIIKQKAENLFNKNLEEEYHSQEHQNNKVLILIKFVAINSGKSVLYNKDVEVGVEEKETEALRKVQQTFSSKVKCQTKMLDKALLIAFTPFSQIDAVVLEIETIIKDLKAKFKEDKWQIEPIVAIETYAKETEIPIRVTCLKKLHKLELKNEIACLSSFRQRYSLMTNQKYNIVGKGIYKIKDKEETVFCIERISST
jgi:S-adenosylmethionine synthetase